jgi:hypothetical protein
LGHDANFSMNFEPSLALSWIVNICHCLLVQVYIRLCHDAKGEGGGGPRFNVIMTLTFPEIVWRCLLQLKNLIVQGFPCGMAAFSELS